MTKEQITEEEKSTCPKCGREGVPWRTAFIGNSGSKHIFFICECGDDWSKFILGPEFERTTNDTRHN